jgi:hypothetical protein
VLLLTLVLIALATAGTAGVVRLGLRQALAASSAERDLQRRWAVTSARAAVLPAAEDVLANAEVRGGQAVRTTASTVVLSGQRVTLVVADEQAKVNVNALLAREGRAGAERLVRGLVRSADSTVPLQLSPAPGDREGPAVISFEQVFPGAGPSELAGQPATADVTCWGDGKLNVRRASRDALRTAVGTALDLSQVESLLDARRKDPRLPVAELLAQLSLTDEQWQAAGELLTDKSACHSLWVVVETDQRAWHSLFVDGPSGGSFAW